MLRKTKARILLHNYQTETEKIKIKISSKEKKLLTGKFLCLVTFVMGNSSLPPHFSTFHLSFPSLPSSKFAITVTNNRQSAEGGRGEEGRGGEKGEEGKMTGKVR